MNASVSTPWAIVEDSDDDFAAFVRAFRDEPVALTRWSTAEAGLAALDGGGTDLRSLAVLVVDLNLPGIDGCEFITQARALDGGLEPTICVLTSSGLPADRSRAAAAGADGYLIKPDGLEGLRALPGLIAAIVAGRSA